MEEKNLTPQESVALIAQMIESSKQRMTLLDLRIPVLWAALSIICAAIVLSVSLTSYTPWINLVWFAIPVIGVPVNFLMVKKNRQPKGIKTTIDTIMDGIWKTVGFLGLVLTAVCLTFNILGHPQAWLAMFYYAFIIVGFGAAATGIVIKESSYIFGGVFSLISGFVVVILNLCSIPLLIVWVLPLYMLCFLLMFVVPSIIIGRKLKSSKP